MAGQLEDRPLEEICPPTLAKDDGGASDIEVALLESGTSDATPSEAGTGLSGVNWLLALVSRELKGCIACNMPMADHSALPRHAGLSLCCCQHLSWSPAGD